ncbi:MAG: ATP-grasp domain-containing protein [Chloroflexota bacterium]
MPAIVAIVYNQPDTGRYQNMGEEKAILGVLDEVGAVNQALEGLGYIVQQVPLVPPLAQARERIRSLQVDLVFNLFEGFDGCPETEAVVAGWLGELGVPVTGCPAETLALALDKARAKQLLEAASINTPRYQLLNPGNLPTFYLRYPCIVKPSGEDASHGVSEESVVNDSAALAVQVARISRLFGGTALVEEFIDGREFNVTVMGDDEVTVLPVSEIVYSLPVGMPRVLTFAAKWEPDTVYFQHTKVTCPAEIDDGLRGRIRETAKAVFRLFGGRGYARVDMRLGADGELAVLEMNPNPDISPGSGAARQAEATGASYQQFIERIIHLARKASR